LYSISAAVFMGRRDNSPAMTFFLQQTHPVMAGLLSRPPMNTV